MSIYLDLLDRQQRVLRVDNALRDRSHWSIVDDIYPSTRKSVSDIIEETTQRLFSSSAGFALFFKAALLIRNNYEDWVLYLKNISEPSPAVFEPFAGNFRLVIFIFMCDCFKVFHFDPHYPFLIGDQRTSRKFVIHNDTFDSEKDIKRVVELWASMGFPEEVCKTQNILLRNDWKQLKESPDSYDEFPIFELFLDMLEVFGFERFLKEDGPDEEDFNYYVPMFVKKKKTHMVVKLPDFIGLMCDEDFDIDESCSVSFYKNKFVKYASIMLSFDYSNESLEVIHKLFPQFPELIPDICREYYLATTYTIGPSSKKRRDGVVVSLAEEEMNYYKAVIKLIGEDMGCETSYQSEAKWDSICHKGVLNMIKRYPHLFVCWETDPIMVKHFHELMR